MDDQQWWLWIAKAIGTISFLVIVVDFFIAKRKIPFYVIAMSLIAFGGGLVYTLFTRLNLIDILFISLLCFCLPLLMWFLCGGSYFLKSRHGKNMEAEKTKKLDTRQQEVVGKD